MTLTGALDLKQGDGTPLADGRVRLALAAAGIFAVLSALSTDDGPVLCPLRRCTGGYCPACGLTRSGGRLLRGDAAGSWQQHPYLLLALAQIGVLGAAWRFGSASLRRRLMASGRPLLAVNAAVLAIIWVTRMVGGAIPVPFLG